MVEIRHEQLEDKAEVRQVTVDAFTHSEFGYHGEADLSDSLRGDSNRLLSLVARCCTYWSR